MLFSDEGSLYSAENTINSNQGGSETFTMQPCMFKPEHEEQDSFVNELCFDKENKTSPEGVFWRRSAKKLLQKTFHKIHRKTHC